MSFLPLAFSSSSLSLSRNTTALGPHHHFSLSRHCCAWLTQACSSPLPARVACSACLPHSPPPPAAARSCHRLCMHPACHHCRMQLVMHSAASAADRPSCRHYYVPRPHHCYTREREKGEEERERRERGERKKKGLRVNYLSSRAGNDYLICMVSSSKLSHYRVPAN